MSSYSSPVRTIPKLKTTANQEITWQEDNQRVVLKGGRIIDPANKVDAISDVAYKNGIIQICAETIKTEPGDRILDCTGLIVIPGLIDMHLHLGDLFDVYESPILKAAKDGVTLGLSPGAGNTFMTPALLGAEVDRGLPLNVGVYLGGSAVLGSSMDTQDLITLFNGQSEDKLLAQKLSRNAVTNSTAHLTIGIKDHMGHFILPDETIEKLYQITSKAGLVFMSHTQDPEHARRMVHLSKGRPLHLGHATAAGCGTHADGSVGMAEVIGLLDHEMITAEFVSSMLLESRGRSDGMKIVPHAQELAYKALQSGKVDIIVSDGQSGSTMKGFGNTRDNIPCIFTLAKLGVLPLLSAVAAMTCNPARLLSQRTGNPYFRNKLGHLAPGALASITVADPHSQEAVYTIVNGRIVAFDGNLVRGSFSAGGLVSKFGMSMRIGVGDLTLYGN